MTESDSPADLARRLTAALSEFNATSEKLVFDNVALGKTIGTTSPATPDSLQIATLSVQVLALVKVVGEIGITLTEHLIDEARPA